MSEMREGAIQTNSKLHSKDSIVFWSSANSFFTEDREERNVEAIRLIWNLSFAVFATFCFGFSRHDTACWR